MIIITIMLLLNIIIYSCRRVLRHFSSRPCLSFKSNSSIYNHAPHAVATMILIILTVYTLCIIICAYMSLYSRGLYKALLNLYLSFVSPHDIEYAALVWLPHCTTVLECVEKQWIQNVLQGLDELLLMTPGLPSLVSRRKHHH